MYCPGGIVSPGWTELESSPSAAPTTPRLAAGVALLSVVGGEVGVSDYLSADATQEALRVPFLAEGRSDNAPRELLTAARARLARLAPAVAGPALNCGEAGIGNGLPTEGAPEALRVPFLAQGIGDLAPHLLPAAGTCLPRLAGGVAGLPPLGGEGGILDAVPADAAPKALRVPLLMQSCHDHPGTDCPAAASTELPRLAVGVAGPPVHRGEALLLDRLLADAAPEALRVPLLLHGGHYHTTADPLTAPCAGHRRQGALRGRSSTTRRVLTRVKLVPIGHWDPVRSSKSSALPGNSRGGGSMACHDRKHKPIEDSSERKN
eukprot:RCo048081